MVKYEHIWDSEITFTVRELKDLLDQYEDTDLVNFWNGETEDGDTGGMLIGESEEDFC